MRDDRKRWPPARGLERPNLTGENLSVETLQVDRQTVISGALDNCLSACGALIAVGGGPDIASGEFYALRQRRDRLLVVNGPALADGWDTEHNVAVTDMSAAYAVLTVSGSASEQLIATGTEFVPAAPSPSVSRLWHGFGILLYRHEQPQTYRMHVRAANLEAVWEMIDSQMNGLAGIAGTQKPYDELANRQGHTISESRINGSRQ